MRRLICVVMAVGTLVACSPNTTPPPAQQPAPQLIQPVYQRFLTACSGVTITEETSQAIAYGTCVGYTRGFADGHQVTVEGIRRGGFGAEAQTARLWCIPPSTPNSTVMAVVVDWIAQHPQDFDNIMSQFDGINAATAVIVKALVTSVDFHKSRC